MASRPHTEVHLAFPRALFGLKYFPFGSDVLDLPSAFPFPRPEVEPGSTDGARGASLAACPLQRVLVCFPAVCCGKADGTGALETRAPGRGPHPHRFFLRRQRNHEIGRVPSDIQRLLCQIQQSCSGMAHGISVFSERCGFLFFLFQTWPSALGRKMVQHFHGVRKVWRRQHRRALGWDSPGRVSASPSLGV